MEILVIIVIAVLILGVAVGPLLAMRSPAEADKLTPGVDPASRSGKEPDASETPPSRPRQAHRGPAVGNAMGADRNIPVAGSLSNLGPLPGKEVGL